MAIHNARNSETDDSFGDLRLGPVERDKISNLLPLFLKFIATLPTKSGNVVYSSFHMSILLIYLGRATQCFFGSAKKCYKKYVKYCYGQAPRPLDSEVFQTARVFHRERRLKHITLEKAYVLPELE